MSSDNNALTEDGPIEQLTASIVGLSLESVLSILTTNGNIVNDIDSSGETPLTTLCRLSQVSKPETQSELLVVLFNHGAKLSVKNVSGYDAVLLASERYHVHLFPLLLQEGIKQGELNSAVPLPKMLHVLLGGDTSCFPNPRKKYELILNYPDMYFQTIQDLIQQTGAIENGSAYIQHALDTQDDLGSTPLHLAAGIFQSKIVEYFLQLDGNPRLKGFDSMTPVQYLADCFTDIESKFLASCHPDRSKHGQSTCNTKISQLTTAMKRIETRAVETLLVLSNIYDLDSMYCNLGGYYITSRRLKNALLGHIGLNELFNMIQLLHPGGKIRSKDIILDYICGLYRAKGKDKDLVSYWMAILSPHTNGKPGRGLITYKNLEWLVDALMKFNRHPRHIRTWAHILVSILTMFHVTDVNGMEVKRWHRFTSIEFYQEMTKNITTIGKRILFHMGDIDCEEIYDDIKLLYSKFEFFLIFFIFNLPYLSTFEKYINIFNEVTNSFHELWSLTKYGIEILNENKIEYPERFIGLIQILKTISQIQNCLKLNQYHILNKLLKNYIEESNPQIWDLYDYQYNSPYLFKIISIKFNSSPSFDYWIKPLENNINILFSYCIDIVQFFFTEWIMPIEFITLQNRLNYLKSIRDSKAGSFTLTINRHTSPNIFLDFIIQQIISAPSPDISRELIIHFHQEPGVGIGPLREFFDILKTYIFNPTFNIPLNNNKDIKNPIYFLPLFKYSNKNKNELIFQNNLFYISNKPLKIDTIYHVPFENIIINNEIKKLYFSIGRILGLTIRHNISLGISFPIVFWKIILNKKITWQEYIENDPEYKFNLNKILEYDFNNNSKWIIYFETCGYISNYNNKIAEIELELNGRDKIVTNENKLKYIELAAKRHFCNSFLYFNELQNGFYDIISKDALRIFSPYELHDAVQGTIHIDAHALKSVVKYFRPGGRLHPTVKYFWEVVVEMDQPTLRRLLAFWSGSSIPPIFGFAEDQWYIKMLMEDGEVSVWPCPQATTCDRELRLLNYPTKEILREKLSIALEHGFYGFDMM